MAQTMSPSPQQEKITDGQIDKAVDAYRAMLRKHRKELSSKEAQEVLTQSAYLGEQIAVLRKHVEALSKMINRRGFKVNRNRTAQAALDATGRRQYTDKNVVKAMPMGEGEEVEICFFQPAPEAYENGLMSRQEFQNQLASRDLVADPIALAAYNEAHPEFARTHPNATQWQDGEGNFYYAAFNEWHDGLRNVHVRRNEHGWDDGWWLCGVRKNQKQALDSRSPGK